MSPTIQNLLTSLVVAILGGGTIAAVLNYLKDRRSQELVEKQAKLTEIFEQDDRRIRANEQALAVVERWNVRLEQKVEDLQSRLSAAESSNAKLREENAVLREKVAQLEERVSRLQEHANELSDECNDLKDEIRKLAGPDPRPASTPQTKS